MYSLKSESGVALVVTLIILTVFSILGLSLGAMTVNNNKLRVLTNNQIEGKLLAEIGLDYFKESLEKELNNKRNTLHQAMKSPSDSDGIIDIIQEITHEGNPIYILNNSQNGGFTIEYDDIPLKETGTSNRIGYKDGTNGPSQPYIRKLDVTITGMPSRNNSNSAKVTINSTFYINTIPGPFHYALSTPGELRLLGGSNIIGHIAADKLVVSSNYRYKDGSGWLVGDSGNDLNPETGFTNNKPYIEGKAFLSTFNFYPLKKEDIPLPNSSTEEDSEDNSTFSQIHAQNNKKMWATRDNLIEYMIPKRESEATITLSAHKPFLPGYEVPDIINGSNTLNNYSVQSYLQEIFNDIDTEDISIINKPLSNDSASFDGDGFDFLDTEKQPKLIIRSDQSKTEPVTLTARFSGKLFNQKDTNEIFILKKKNSSSVKVEIGSNDQFLDVRVDAPHQPFSFNGTMYIQGDVDIFGKIDMQGTIFVNGDVLISNVTNVNNKGNFVIISTGTITMISPVEEVQDHSTIRQWEEIVPLRAFLYSEKSLQLFSLYSTNKIIGGIASGNGDQAQNTTSYLEINTKREYTSNIPDTLEQKNSSSPPYLASRFSIQFDRNIFERPTPGLPVNKDNDRFYIDVYDISYK